MKPMKAVFIASSILAVCIALILAVGSFTQVNSQTTAPSDEKKKVEKGSSEKDVVIGHLQFRDKVVTISKGQKGTAYTVKSTDGKTLDANLNEKNFQAKYPSLFDQIKDGRANNDATLRKGEAVRIPPPDPRVVHSDTAPAK
jgi:hypothetical protein